MWQEILIDPTLRVQSLGWLDWLDLALVTAVFYLLITAARRSRATFLLRGATVLGFILAAVALLLPLPAFGLLIRAILIALLIALPVVFQREVQRLLEEFGRSIGLVVDDRLRETEEVMNPVVRAAEQMAQDRVGALVVLEGKMPLAEIAATGVAIEGHVSQELLKSIFYPKNSLHDGAVLIRGQTVVAASCVLPLSSRPGNGRRLGTRHRAAMGASERSDALVIVVSEETGKISVAHSGELTEMADLSALREQILTFGRGPDRRSRAVAGLRWAPGLLWDGLRDQLRGALGRLGLSFFLAVTLWWYVLSTSSDLPQVTVDDVALTVEGAPQTLTLSGELPQSVDLVVRTVDRAAERLDDRAFEATLSLAGRGEGLQVVPVEINSRIDEPVRILEVRPATVEVNLAPMTTRTLTVAVSLEDEESLPAVYEISGQPEVEPAQVQISGPAPLVEAVSEVRATLSLSNTTSPVESVRHLVAVDENGEPVEGVTVEPAQTVVRLPIRARSDAREVGVAIATTGEPADGYWVSGLQAQPSSVVITGPPAVLAGFGRTVATQPVDISDAAGDLSIDIPLDLPTNVTAVTNEGRNVSAIHVTVRVSARRGSITLARPVEVTGAPEHAIIVVAPRSVDLLLTGPLDILEDIRARPDLVRVVVDAGEVAEGEEVEQEPQVVAPPGISSQLVPALVVVRREP